MDIRKANANELIDAAGVAMQMCSSHTLEELVQDFKEHFRRQR